MSSGKERAAHMRRQQQNMVGAGSGVRSNRKAPPAEPPRHTDRDKKRRRNKNENILCAIIALMKELDKSGLEFVKMDATKRINKFDAKMQA